MIKASDINRIWADKEVKYGVKIPQEFRILVMNDWEPTGDDEIDAQDLSGLIDDSIERALKFNYSPPKNNTTKPGNRRRYQRCFEKRLYLVEYVLNESRSLNMNMLAGRTFNKKKRISWKYIVGRWNKAHPGFPIGMNVLKQEFYRAIREPELQSEFFDRKHKELVAKWAPLAAQLKENMERWWKAIKVHFPQVNNESQLMRELKKSPLFKGMDIKNLGLAEILQILDKGGKL